jgi:hypothetical protein
MNNKTNDVSIYQQDYDKLTKRDNTQSFADILNEYIIWVGVLAEENRIMREKVIEAILEEERDLKQREIIADVVEVLIEVQNANVSPHSKALLNLITLKMKKA